MNFKEPHRSNHRDPQANAGGLVAPPRFATADTPGVRSLPASLPAEEHLLSCCIREDGGEVVSRATAAGVTPASFHDSNHAIVYEALQALVRVGKPTDQDVLGEFLRTSGQLAQIGGWPVLVQISSKLPTTAQAEYFIGQVLALATRRAVIRAAQRITEEAFAAPPDAGADDIIAGARAHVDGVTGQNAGAIRARNIATFAMPPENDPSILLGNRYLNRGDGAVVVSTSGMGKSAFTIQAAATWALGRPFVGIRPNGPLRSLVVQAEDSDGDIAEMWLGAKHGLGLSGAEASDASSRVMIVTDRVHRGETFVGALRGWIAKHKPDLVWINPLLAFCGGDITEAAEAGKFLREGLNSLNEPPSFGYMLVNHTTKPRVGKERSDHRWNEVMYSMAGSADLTNWARAVLSLQATRTEGDFNLVLAKRGRRAGVVREVPQGAAVRHEIVTTIPLRHARGKIPVEGRAEPIPLIFWETREPDGQTEQTPVPKGGRPREHTFAEFAGVFPLDAKEGKGFRALHKAACDLKPVGRNAFATLIEEAVGVGLIACDLTDPERPRYHRVIAKSIAA